VATRAEITAALQHYTQAGDLESARVLKATLAAMPADSDGTTFSAPKQPAPPSAADRALGAPAEFAKARVGDIEALGTLGSGTIAAPLAGFGAGIAATARQILSGEFGSEEASRAVETAAEKAAEAVTYVPRTDAGRARVGAIGKLVAPAEDAMMALGPLAAEIPTISQTCLLYTSPSPRD
jgi:hypothetical protein